MPACTSLPDPDYCRVEIPTKSAMIYDQVNTLNAYKYICREAEGKECNQLFLEATEREGRDVAKIKNKSKALSEQYLKKAQQVADCPALYSHWTDY